MPAGCAGPGLDYDVPFIPVVLAAVGIPSRSVDREGKGSSSSEGRARKAAAEDHCSRSGIDT
ncbi:hypothetical protein SY2F82_13940 [Streptomyces sp. Y2F8-2]|nr:hypothetical protein SY2F82_13940 [Streptomyces sp. Y2F8-2]